MCVHVSVGGYQRGGFMLKQNPHECQLDVKVYRFKNAYESNRLKTLHVYKLLPPFGFEEMACMFGMMAVSGR